MSVVRFRGYQEECRTCGRRFRAETIIGLEAALLEHAPRCEIEKAARAKRALARQEARDRQGDLFAARADVCNDGEENA